MRLRRLLAGSLAITAIAISTVTATAGADSISGGAYRPKWAKTPSCTIGSTNLITCTARVVALDPKVQAVAWLAGDANFVCPSNPGIGGSAQSGTETTTTPIRNGESFTLSWQVPSEPTSFSDPSADNTCTAGWTLAPVGGIVASLQIYQPWPTNFVLGYQIID
jgi:hypothetical protein